MLAAGGGRRLGGPKALLRRDGTTLVEWAVATAREAGCTPIVVVLGCAAEQVIQSTQLDGVTVVVNSAWTTGMGSSLRAGLAALATPPEAGPPAHAGPPGETGHAGQSAQSGRAAHAGPDAAVVLLVDMPGITAAAIRRVAALPYPEALVTATYAGKRGHPIMLGRGHWSGVSTLARSDVGARPYLLARKGQVQEVACDGVADNSDVDTPDDAARWGIEIPEDLARRATRES